MSPRVSILTPVYNREEFLPRAIESVLAQQFSDWELIISDNQSSDYSGSIGQHYADLDERIKYYYNDTHVSGVENFNLCYERVHPESPYVALLASDDWWEPTLLSTLLPIADQYPDVVCVHADMYRTTVDRQIINTYADLFRHNTPPAGLHQAAKELLIGNFINIMAAVINRAVWQRITASPHLLDPTLKLTPDYDFWLQLFLRGAKGYHIARPLAYYRKHKDAMTMRERLIDRLKEEVVIFEERIVAVCPEELQSTRLYALQKLQAEIGFELLAARRANEAPYYLHKANQLAAGRRLDIRTAIAIASLPTPESWRAVAWKIATAIANRLRTQPPKE
jgi:glycosyltransferase involved in cell wall biosynthesis